MIRRLVSRTLWHSYDCLGRLLAANLIWFAGTVPLCAGVVFFSRLFSPPLSTVVLASLLSVVFLNPLGFALGEMAQRLAETGGTDLATFWNGLRQYVVRGLLSMSVHALATTTLGLSLLFYGSGTFAWLGAIGNYAATGLTIWVALFVAAISCYWVPIGVGLPGRSPRLAFMLKRSALSALEAPGFSAGLLLLTVASSLFWVGTMLGGIAFWMSFERVLHAEARQLLRERRDAVERLRARGEPPTRQAIRAELERVWANRPKRRLKELIRPWDA